MPLLAVRMRKIHLPLGLIATLTLIFGVGTESIGGCGHSTERSIHLDDVSLARHVMGLFDFHAVALGHPADRTCSGPLCQNRTPDNTSTASELAESCDPWALALPTDIPSIPCQSPRVAAGSGAITKLIQTGIERPPRTLHCQFTQVN